MSNAITAVIAIALILVAVLTLTAASLASASEISMSFNGLLNRSGDRARTELTLITADIGGSGADIDISIRNTGQTALTNFSDWDVVVRYYASSSNNDLNIVYASYKASSPADEEWTVEGLYIDISGSKSEVYEPNVLNPGEEMIVRVNISPVIPVTTDNLVSIGVVNGVTLSAQFSR